MSECAQREPHPPQLIGRPLCRRPVAPRLCPFCCQATGWGCLRPQPPGTDKKTKRIQMSLPGKGRVPLGRTDGGNRTQCIWVRAVQPPVTMTTSWTFTPEGEEPHQRGRSLTWTLSSQGLTALKLSSTVTSYMTTTPSAFRKNCLVMLRYLQPPRESRSQQGGGVHKSH